MYENELNKVINDAKYLSVVKVYNKLIHMEQVQGGIISNKKFLADELGLSIQSVCNAIRMLKASGYLSEIKFNGQMKFILNHLDFEKSDKNDAEKVVKVEKSDENIKPRQEIVRKGGKTVTRTMIPGF